MITAPYRREYITRASAKKGKTGGGKEIEKKTKKKQLANEASM